MATFDFVGFPALLDFIHGSLLANCVGYLRSEFLIWFSFVSNNLASVPPFRSFA